MGEAIISRGYIGADGSGGSSSHELKTEIITNNTVWVVPKALNQSFSVRIFGGGGGASAYYNEYFYSSGGGGGYMNNAILNLNQGSAISIIIGTGGYGGVLTFKNNSNGNGHGGGTTSFGTHLSANGGFGAYLNHGGDGGSGGSGTYGGTGYQFGGGGATYGNGGNGGKWGGGGGSYNWECSVGGCLYENSLNTIEVTGYSRLAGNGGNRYTNAKNGTNTIGMGLDFEGAGLAAININAYKDLGGGGGYGGCGGYNYGGGGGYGANGGNNCGGGGGYGGRGGDGREINGGGGGGYGHGGGVNSIDGAYGGGGGSLINQSLNSSNLRFQSGNGGNGICIIQYYI